MFKDIYQLLTRNLKNTHFVVECIHIHKALSCYASDLNLCTDTAAVSYCYVRAGYRTVSVGNKITCIGFLTSYYSVSVIVINNKFCFRCADFLKEVCNIIVVAVNLCLNSIISRLCLFFF